MEFSRIARDRCSKAGRLGRPGLRGLAGAGAWRPRYLSRALAVGLVAAMGAVLVGVPRAEARQTLAIESPLPPSGGLAGSYLAAINAGARNDTRAAAAYFLEALRRDPDNAELRERAFVAVLSNGDMTDAFRIAQRMASAESAHGLARLTLAVRAFHARHYVTARTHLSHAGGAPGGDVTSRLLTAWAWLGSRDPARALTEIDGLRNPALAAFRDYQAALIANVAGQSGEAVRRINAAYEASATTLSIVLAYAGLNMRNNQPEKALEALRELEKGLPRHPTLQAALREAQAGRAVSLYATDPVEGAAEVLYQLSTVGDQGGRELAPLIYLRLALFLNPEHDLAIVSLASIFERLNQHARAIDAYEMMPERSPLRQLAQLQIGNALESLEKKDEALKHLRAIVKRDPSDPEAVLALGNLHRMRREFAEAAELYTRALDLAEDKDSRSNWTTYYFRGIAHERMSNWPAAEADFKKTLELYPDQPSVLNYLGYSWVDRNMNLEEAYRLLRRAVELRPTDGAIVDSLGWAYYKRGLYEDALRELERAVELQPADPVINDHLGDVYWKVGRRLEARFQWIHARDLDPEPEDKKRILRKLEVGLDVVEREEADQRKVDAPGGSTAGGGG